MVHRGHSDLDGTQSIRLSRGSQLDTTLCSSTKKQLIRFATILLALQMVQPSECHLSTQNEASLTDEAPTKFESQKRAEEPHRLLRGQSQFELDQRAIICSELIAKTILCIVNCSDG